MYDLDKLIILVLAVDAIMVTYFRGSLFATLRATCEAWANSPSLAKQWIGGFMSCPICLPVYLAILVFLVSLIPYGWVALFILATTGLASRLSNDVWPVKPGPRGSSGHE